MKSTLLLLVAALTVGCDPVQDDALVLLPPLGGSPDARPAPEPAPEPDSAPSPDDAAGEPVDGGRWGVDFENAWGDRVEAALFLPRGAEAAPAVIVLHGSGGLFDEPADDEAAFPIDPARRPLERQFQDWAELLAGEGWAVLLPSSFASRGFYDWNATPPDGVGTDERLRWRTADALAAIDYACRHPRMDCERLAVVGMSNGGSAVLLSLFDALERVDGLDGVEPPRQDVQIGVALYPGCGLQGMVSLALPDAYLPRRPLHVFHGSEDPLVSNCHTRAAQAALAAERLGVAERFTLQVFEGAGHSFDSSPDGPIEEQARAATRSSAVALLRAAFAAHE